MRLKHRSYSRAYNNFQTLKEENEEEVLLLYYKEGSYWVSNEWPTGSREVIEFWKNLSFRPK